VADPVAVLIGAPGAGKTRIGKRLARLLDVPFVDTDSRIVAANGPITEIFANHGEPHFRQLERSAVHRALHEHAIVALGGGAVLDPATQSELTDKVIVQLTVSFEAVAARGVTSKRPLLANGIEAWQQLVAARQPIYDRLASVTFDTSTLPAERVAAQISAWIQERTA
jgi:shikimate kinase